MYFSICSWLGTLLKSSNEQMKHTVRDQEFTNGDPEVIQLINKSTLLSGSGKKDRAPCSATSTFKSDLLHLLVYANVPSRGWGLLMKCLEWNEDRMSASATPHVPSAPMFIVRAGPSYLNPGKGLLRWDSTLRLSTKQWPNNCGTQTDRNKRWRALTK